MPDDEDLHSVVRDIGRGHGIANEELIHEVALVITQMRKRYTDELERNQDIVVLLFTFRRIAGEGRSPLVVGSITRMLLRGFAQRVIADMLGIEMHKVADVLKVLFDWFAPER